MTRVDCGLLERVREGRPGGPRPTDAGHLDVGLAGDVLLTDRLLVEGPRKDQIDDLRRALWSPFEGCSVVVANFEGPMTRQEVPATQKAYNVRSAPWAAEVFDDRFVVCLANNHIMDYGPDGLRETIEALDAAGVAYAGAGVNLTQASAPRFLRIGGVEVAVIGAADPRFQAATATSPGTCPATVEGLVELVTDARRRAPLVVVSVHMGLEFVHAPTMGQIRLAEACLGAGARIVQFHHSHCIGGCASDARGVALFGTGNHAFPTLRTVHAPRSRRGAAWRVRYSPDEDAVVSLAAEPLALDRRGRPRPLTGRAAARQLGRIRRYGRRLSSPRTRRLWQLGELASPGFLLPSVRNYALLLARGGPTVLWRSFVAGLKAQLDR